MASTNLTAGTRLGPYEVISPLGSGGMGEVYRARDTRLDRVVALKVLPAALAEDQRFRTRFDREARAISQLQHPHICTLYDVGESNGTAYLVMELLQGQTLAERLTAGALPLDEALRIAIDIADALAGAHKQGIVHRDLKPQNIMLSKEGAKLLDFGLAKTAAPAVSLSDMSTDETTSADLTGAGTILGTLRYMAPEQVEGREADARSDIWAFGAVLYEMLAGQTAFSGESSAALVGAILKDRPLPLSARRVDVPPMLDQLVSGCLERNPDDRWEGAADLKRQLRWISSPQVGVTRNAGVGLSWRRALPWAIAALVSIAAVALFLRRPAESAPPTYATIELPPDFVLGEDQLTASLPLRTPMVLTPDGRSLILQVTRNGVQLLASRSLERPDVRVIPGTEGAHVPFVSPDGKWVGFWANNELRKIPTEGGLAVNIAHVNATRGPNGAVWGTGDFIIYGDAASGRINRVSASGGDPTPVTKEPPTGRQYVAPFLLPDGKSVMFSDVRVLDDATDARLTVQTIGGDDARVVMNDASDGRVLPSGELAFMRLSTLMTVPFDSAHATVTGSPLAAMDDVMLSGLRGAPGVEHPAAGMFAVSPLGALAVVRGSVVGANPSVLFWRSRDGAVATAEPSNGAPSGDRQQRRISPDGTRAVVSVVTPLQRELWIADWARDLWTRCTDCGAFRAEWAPDGRRLLLGRGSALVVHAIDGSSSDQVLVQEGGDATAVSPGPWLPDGRIIYQSAPASDPSHSEIKILDPGSHTGRVVVPAGSGTEPAVSPNGRWMAYRTTSDLGDALYYLTSGPTGTTSALFIVDVVEKDQQLVASRPRELTHQDYRQSCTPRRCYDLSPDGLKFLLRDRRAVEPVKRVDLVLNWAGTLRSKSPAR